MVPAIWKIHTSVGPSEGVTFVEIRTPVPHLKAGSEYQPADLAVAQLRVIGNRASGSVVVRKAHVADGGVLRICSQGARVGLMDVTVGPDEISDRCSIDREL